MAEFDADGLERPTLQALIDNIRRKIGDATAPIYLGIYRTSGRACVEIDKSIIYGFPGDYGRIFFIAESVSVVGLDGTRTPDHVRYLTLSHAPTMEAAADYLYNVTAQMNTLMQFSANAPLDIISETLLIENRPDEELAPCRETPFHSAPAYPQPCRVVDKFATVALANSLWGHGERPRITRAMVQYEAALGQWRDGGRPLALMHLYMGVEALTKAALREELRARGISEHELMVELGVRPHEARSGTELLSRVRLHRIFAGDAETYARARSFSDALEHGFGDDAALWTVPPSVHEATASYLRTKIIELLRLVGQHTATLLEPPYDTVPSAPPTPHYFSKVPYDKIDWRANEFVVIGARLALDGATYDGLRREYTPRLRFLNEPPFRKP